MLSSTCEVVAITRHDTIDQQIHGDQHAKRVWRQIPITSAGLAQQLFPSARKEHRRRFMRDRVAFIAALGFSAMLAGSAYGDVIYNNLTPNNMIAIASRPSPPSSFEIEAGDDFVSTNPVSVMSASFVGLVVSGSGGT